MPTAFTPLIEPSSAVTQTPPPAPFAVGLTYLLGQCCALTYTQMDDGSIDLANFSTLVLAGELAGYTLAASNLQPFTRSESTGPSATVNDIGDYYTTQAGFGVQLALTPPGGSNAATITVIALRGTRTWTEWISDVEALPAVYDRSIDHAVDGLGSVHAGFYADYTVGTDGATAGDFDTLSSTPANRAAGSLAQQVATYVSALSAATVYVTGHSLGAALAGLCALDIAVNFASNVGVPTCVTLASPLIAIGLSDVPTLDNQQMFLQSFQQSVPNSYQIANACDIVPISPPGSVTLGPLTLTCLPVAKTTVSFCVQTGDIGGNHGCVETYVPYLQQLANAFT